MNVISCCEFNEHIYVQCVSPFYEELNVCAHNSHTCESRLLCEKVSLL